MKKITITLPDGSKKEFESGATPLDVAKSIGSRLAAASLAAKFNGHVVDLSAKLTSDGQLQLLTFDSPEGIDVFRHSSAHILAAAVRKLFPNVKLAIGPPVEEGFYYDFDLDEPFKPEDMKKIEEEVHKIISANLPFERLEVPREKALQMVKGEPYKTELVTELPPGTVISFYKTGNEFTDLCQGPHVPSTGYIKGFRVTKFAGAYWRGDQKNRQLQRIYGISFPSAKQLEDHLKLLEEAEKRDHRKLGTALDLFSFREEGPGFPFFHPNGTLIYNELINFSRALQAARGYQEIRTPLVLSKDLWVRSGHWDHYRENMYFTKMDERDFAIKPMNCPGAMLVYGSTKRSYRELPLRLSEYGIDHRHELSGVLHGLMRVRSFTQDDTHIFVTPDQLESEVVGVMELTDLIYKTFGFEYTIELSTKPENSMGEPELWERAEKALAAALQSRGVKYNLNPGDGAFYGPKIDFHIRDAIGRTWQCGTIQVDFQMPLKFNLTYVGDDGQEHTPIVIHRAIYGSMERFIGILTEHFAGHFPVWLSPIQVQLLPVADRHLPACRQVAEQLRAHGLRVAVDERGATVNYKIREAQLQKIPYMLVIGDKEAAGTLNVRERSGKVYNQTLQEFTTSILAHIRERKL